ncbi:MAG: SDR family oxidoreductase [Candidatus Hydrogenedentes bacterium]|nr:SDR family oxidoreductase [Candidatus Hydrogenedentota bacterium]
MSKKVLVTGASGFVGGSVLHHAPADWDMHACSRSPLAGVPANVVHHAFDLADKAKTAEIVASVKPDAIIHIAAIANIDYAEANQEETALVNTETTGRLARLAAEHGARFLFCSTDNVFDGVDGFYSEDALVSPVNFYGRTKVAAEVLAHEALENSVIVRVALVIGMPIMGSGNSFLVKMEENLREGREIQIPENEVRSPVDVITLGKSLLELAGNDFTGTINLAGSTCLNRYEMAKQIARKLGHSEGLIVPTDSNAMPGRAPRPNNVSLANALAKETLKTPMRDLDEALDMIFGR